MNTARLRYGVCAQSVTGGAGFIGSNLVDALVARGDEVVVIDDLSFGTARVRQPERRRSSSATSATAIDLDGAEVVFHLAAQTDVQTSVARAGATTRT